MYTLLYMVQALCVTISFSHVPSFQLASGNVQFYIFYTLFTFDAKQGRVRGGNTLLH